MTTNEHIKAAFIETDNFKFHHECANEIERLRKWQQEAACWLRGIRTTMVLVGTPKDKKDALDRLIAEAQEAKNA